MWHVGSTKLQIKDSAWQLYLINNNKLLETPNPGPQVLIDAPPHAPFNGNIMLEWPMWWFSEEDVEEVKTVCLICNKKDTYAWQHCPKCGACPEHQEVRNHSLMWHDGDVHCIKCEAFVRSFDAG